MQQYEGPFARLVQHAREMRVALGDSLSLKWQEVIVCLRDLDRLDTRIVRGGVQLSLYLADDLRKSTSIPSLPTGYRIAETVIAMTGDEMPVYPGRHDLNPVLSALNGDSVSFYQRSCNLRGLLISMPGTLTFPKEPKGGMGIVIVRNKLIEHANVGDSKVGPWSFGWSSLIGPKLRPNRSPAFIPSHEDVGYFLNRNEFLSALHSTFGIDTSRGLLEVGQVNWIDVRND